jgi:putative peptidoglycan binding protein/N-acetylmuramoyl-L-alanine amidase-like protein
VKLERRSVFGWGPSGAGHANPRNGIAVHYDGSNQSLAKKQHESCRTYWKNTRKFHMNTRGWADIGYSFAVCPHGVVLEGRGLNKQQAAQPGGNSTWYSVTFMSGPSEQPTDAQIKAFRELRAWLRGKGVGSALRPHSAFVATSCCGDILRKLISNGTLAAGVPAAPKPSTPKPSTPKPAPKPAGKAPKFPGKLITQPPVMHSAAVKTWQTQMRKRGWSIAVDGAYGPASEKVCRQFQAQKGLGVDGIVGPRTWAAAWTAPIT